MKVVFNAKKRQVRFAFRKPDGKIETRTVENVREATVTETLAGDVKVSAKRWGFCVDPGLGVVYHDGPRPAGDAQFFYAGRWGANLGVYHRNYLRVYLAVNYSLSRIHLSNVGLWAGSNLNSELVFGIRFQLN